MWHETTLVLVIDKVKICRFFFFLCFFCFLWFLPRIRFYFGEIFIYFCLKLWIIVKNNYIISKITGQTHRRVLELYLQIKSTDQICWLPNEVTNWNHIFLVHGLVKIIVPIIPTKHYNSAVLATPSVNTPESFSISTWENILTL